MMKCYLVLQFIYLVSCAQVKEKNKEISLPGKTDLEFTWLHTFSSEDNKILGNIFIHPIENDRNVFDYMLILIERDNRSDTLFQINKSELISRRGLDIKVYEKGFYGYTVVLLRDDYIVLNYLRDFGESVSDNITIKWNKTDGLFEVLKAP